MSDHHSNSGKEILSMDQRGLAITRTRLANRRTFLSWCRTTLSFMAFGFLLEKVDIFLLSRNTPLSEALLGELGLLGKIAFVAGPVVLLIAGWRYHRLERELGYDTDRLLIIPEAILVGTIVISAMIYLFR